jgi:hypothetical protein
MIPGRFEGLIDAQWQILEPLLPKAPEKRGKGYPMHRGEKFAILSFGCSLQVQDGVMCLKGDSGVLDQELIDG